MLGYIIKRVVRMIPQVFIISVLAFIIIQLPPGDFLTEYLNNLRSSGVSVNQDQVDHLTAMYGLDKPLTVQYLKWIGGILTRLDLGYSFQFAKPVKDILLSRMGTTFMIALLSFIVSWGLAIPIGIYVAVKQYSIADYIFTFIGFIGLATPGFLLALVFMYYAFTKFGLSVGGLNSPEYLAKPWDWARFKDMLAHLWLPVVILAVGGTANIIRTLRATMLDELRKPYVTVARSKGLSELSVLLRYPIPIALNPIISTIGWLLVWFFSGGMIIEVVLNLPTAGPVLWTALLRQDMYTAGAYILITGFLYAIGSLISDIVLSITDPRVRFGSVEGL
jgi:peptide/nickel transport system permease protein